MKYGLLLGSLFASFALACGDSTADADGSGGTGASSGAGGGTSGAAGSSGSGGASASALDGECPAGFSVQEGLNDSFPSPDGPERQFHVLLPDDVTTPRPVFVALTGTVQAELDFAAQSGLDQLPADGWIVIVPVRTCSQNGTNCNGLGSDGRVWEPWYDAQVDPDDDAGPDVRFVEAATRCVATQWPLDEAQLHIGGISAGGSFTNRTMAFNSDFFAGGVPASGNWYGGRAGPVLGPVAMDRSIVILIWGGPMDVWPPVNPFVDYDPETKQASEYFAAQPEAVTVSCSGTHGHIWPTAFTPWLASTLLSHPKGSDPTAFELQPTPPGFECVVGVYTDH